MLCQTSLSISARQFVTSLTLALLTMQPAQAQQYQEGQVWQYKARPGEASSTLLINRVDVEPKLGEVYHISVREVKVKNRLIAGGVSTDLPHLPVSRQTLDSSVTKFVGIEPINPGYREGYGEWRQAFEQGHAGVFSVPVAEIVGFVESALAK